MSTRPAPAPAPRPATQRTGAPRTKALAATPGPTAAAPGAALGLPRFLASGLGASPRQAEAEARAAARPAAPGLPPAALSPAAGSPFERHLSQRLAASAGPGQALAGEQAATQPALAPALAQRVRLHTDSHAAEVTRQLGAHAVTAGPHIFFAPGAFAPGQPQGRERLAHELAHVQQQGGQPQALHADINGTHELPLGVFSIAMAAPGSPVAGQVGLDGNITFTPKPDGPYSAEIGLVQAVQTLDLTRTAADGSNPPLDWRQVQDVNTGNRGTEAGRMELNTPGTAGGAPAGWGIDALPSGSPRGSDTAPSYAAHFGNTRTDYGWLRAPDDFGPATLHDYPQTDREVQFSFETVAMGMDNQVVYGALHWGFSARRTGVSGEYQRVVAGASPVFNEALERYRGYYVHEKVVLYFDTGADTPMPGEEAKLGGIADYLGRYPDVEVAVIGFADLRGSEADNQGLSDRRAQSARGLLEASGVAAARIVSVGGIGEVDMFSQRGTAPGARQPISEGRYRANRRVEISFQHSAETPHAMNPP